MIFSEAIDQQIVDDSSLRSCQGGVLCLAVNQFGNVVGSDAVNEGDRVATTHLELAHVGNVKQARVRSRTKVFFDSAGRILDRHVPSAEVDHATACLAMGRIEWRSFKLWGD